MVFQVVRRTPHSIRVCRLYRRILKEQDSWLGHRGQWNEIALDTRRAFDANKNAPMGHALALVEDAEAQLQYWKHPNPYISESLKLLPQGRV